LTIRTWASPALVLPGEVVTLTARAACTGTQDLQQTVITLTLPSDLDYVAGSAGDGSYLSGSHAVTWTFSTLSIGQVLTVTAQVSVPVGSSSVVHAWDAAVEGDLDGLTSERTEDPGWLSVGEAMTDTLEAGGGTLLSPNGLVTLTVPSGAVTQTTDIQIASYPVPSLAVSERRWRVFFDVQAMGEAGEKLWDENGHTVFLEPLTVTVALTGTSSWFHPYLAHQPNRFENKWEDVPSQYAPETQRLTAELTTFSGYGAGETNEDTPLHHLLTTLPDVNTFSGAATYAYPLDLPAGRNGLAPNLALTYNSGGLNGMLGLTQSGAYGLGWSLSGQMEIVRSIGTHQGSTEIKWVYSRHFDLVINGASHRLVGPEELPNNGGCRYYAEPTGDALHSSWS
jgi:uncharacterized repeat protein (TIGR01451 family)